MRYLKTNTAVRVTVGPFLDKTDGITPEVALTVTSEKLTFVVDSSGVPTLVIDANPTASGGTNDMFHIVGDEAGFYDLELSAANTNYVGRAILSINDTATHCPVFHEFNILNATAYDALILDQGVGLRANVHGWLGTTPLTPATSGMPSVDLVNWRGTAPLFLSSQCVQTEPKFVQSGAINASSIAAGAIDSGALATTAVDEIVTGLLAGQVEAQGTYTVKQVLSILLAVVAGRTSGGGATFLTPNGVATRVVASTNVSNERTGMTLTPSA